MFINVGEELKKARNEGYGIGAFNTNNLEVTKAICKAAKELDQPIIIQTTPSATEYAGLEQIFNIVRTEIESTGIKAAIHLDHGKDFNIAQKCIEAGYRSVMIDGSKLPFAENVALTKRVVEFAHPRNVTVEGEVGVIGTDEGGNEKNESLLSSPDEVKQFVDLTGIDSVAVSIGNQHGAPKGEKINLKLLGDIAKLIEIPLVLHGSSGISDEEIQEAVKIGISKFNVDTNIRKAFISGLKELTDDTTDYRDVLKISMQKVEEVVKERIILLGACSK
jgi:fructose-bisphosphate aldolase class II